MRQKRPWWIWLLMAAVIAPVFFTLHIITSLPETLEPEAKALMRFYPAVQLAYAWLIWASWPTRRTLAWVLLAMGLLTGAAMMMIN